MKRRKAKATGPTWQEIRRRAVDDAARAVLLDPSSTEDALRGTRDHLSLALPSESELDRYVRRLPAGGLHALGRLLRGENVEPAEPEPEPEPEPKPEPVEPGPDLVPPALVPVVAEPARPLLPPIPRGNERMTYHPASGEWLTPAEAARRDAAKTRR